MNGFRGAQGASNGRAGVDSNDFNAYDGDLLTFACQLIQNYKATKAVLKRQARAARSVHRARQPAAVLSGSLSYRKWQRKAPRKQAM